MFWAASSWIKPLLRSFTDFLIPPMRILTLPPARLELSDLLNRREKLFFAAFLAALKKLGMQLLMRATDTSHTKRISNVATFPIRC